MTRIADVQTLADIARFQAENAPEKIAFYFEDDAITYRDFHLYSNQLANGLLDLGVQPDERICYLGKNTNAYFELLIGASKVRAVTCPINWRLAEAEIRYILSNSRSRVLFAGPEFIEIATQLKAKQGDKLTVIPLSNYAAWRDQQKTSDINITPKTEDDVLQLYTSGTTGHPKGVRMSNRAMIANRRRELDPSTPDWNRWSSDDVGLISMPCFHIGGTSFGLASLYAGATGVIMSQFNTSQQLDLMVKYGTSKQFIVPSALQIILDDPRVHNTDFSKLNYIQYGASPIPIQLMKDCIKVFGCEFVQKYGMTETCGSCVALGPEDHSIPENDKMKSVGKPLRGIDIKIVDNAGRTLPHGQTGEIVIRSPANMSGYWDNEEASKAAFFDGGWLRSGDVGYLDADGYLYIQDRIKDMIVSGGENVYSAEVETALLSNPAIKDAAVVGVPDEKWGEAVMAFIVASDTSITQDDIIRDCKTKIAKYKCPKQVAILEALPRNASGKILKRELRLPYWENFDRAVN